MMTERTIDASPAAPTPERIRDERQNQLEMFRKFLNELNKSDEVQLRGRSHPAESKLSQARGT